MELKQLMKEIEDFLKEMSKDYVWNQDSENSIVISWRQQNGNENVRHK